MNNKQVLVYGILESHFKKLIKFQKFIEIFHCCMDRLRNNLLFIYKNHFKKQKHGTEPVQETFRILKFR